ncbi:hypothetical protein IC229_29025 [Spirosoma sp. BT702]|uniref:Uncharacterized protein n=1 Tax=Spirosoma profusum TaxID=2771354 RepID=A0A927AUM7_9BACT|nr:hypothetical protein [Spirosoma profusum]MBD2704713.1 hypothetical protein [Spirosoma profusum]
MRFVRFAPGGCRVTGSPSRGKVGSPTKRGCKGLSNSRSVYLCAHHQPSRALGAPDKQYKMSVRQCLGDRPHGSKLELFGSFGGFGRQHKGRSWEAFWGSVDTRNAPVGPAKSEFALSLRQASRPDKASGGLRVRLKTVQFGLARV